MGYLTVNLHFTLCCAMSLYIQHSKITPYNFIPSLLWSTSLPKSFYYNLLRFLCPTVIVHCPVYSVLNQVTLYIQHKITLCNFHFVLLLQSPYTQLYLSMVDDRQISFQLLETIFPTTGNNSWFRGFCWKGNMDTVFYSPEKWIFLWT